MNLKTATLIALIGIAIKTLSYILINTHILPWYPSYRLLPIIIGNGSLLLFLGILHSKQK